MKKNRNCHAVIRVIYLSDDTDWFCVRWYHSVTRTPEGNCHSCERLPPLDRPPPPALSCNLALPHLQTYHLIYSWGLKNKKDITYVNNAIGFVEQAVFRHKTDKDVNDIIKQPVREPRAGMFVDNCTNVLDLNLKLSLKSNKSINMSSFSNTWSFFLIYSILQAMLVPR